MEHHSRTNIILQKIGGIISSNIDEEEDNHFSSGCGRKTRRKKANFNEGFHYNNLSFLACIVILLFYMLSSVPSIDGLQCYECLSLSCPSLAVCESIKKTMQQVFVPKGHIIHFNPSDECPEKEPTNSTKWDQLQKECRRADSVCLVSPVEVISVIDASKNGKQLESETPLTTTGFLRGCASRRKLQESEATIRVHVNLKGASRRTSSSTTSLNGTSSVYGQSSQDVEMELDISKLKFDDGWEVSRVHSHEFYVDQGTVNATKCYEDNCNTMVRIRSSGNINGMVNNNLVVLLLAFILSFTLSIQY